MDTETAVESELRRLIEKFEPGREFCRFRDTAVYHSLLFNYELEQKRERQHPAAMDCEPVFA